MRKASQQHLGQAITSAKAKLKDILITSYFKKLLFEQRLGPVQSHFHIRERQKHSYFLRIKPKLNLGH